MKISKANQAAQRKLIERKTATWLSLRSDRVPPSGWLKAIRGALGINTRQLAARLGVQHVTVQQYEKSEAEGAASLQTLQKAAKAMRCRLIYAIVPEEPFSSLEAILDNQAEQAARTIVARVDHTMRLEQQGLAPGASNEQVLELAAKLKAAMDPSLWGEPKSYLDRKGGAHEPPQKRQRKSKL